jgi:hypothetical protein
VINRGALLCGRQRGTAHNTLEAGRRCGDSTVDVLSRGMRTRQKVGRLVHADEFGCEEEEKGGFEFTAPFLRRVPVDKVGDVERHEVDDFSRCVLGKGREERLDVGFVALGCDDYDFVDAVVVPTGEEFIYGTMEGLTAERAGAGVRGPVGLRKAVVEGRSHHQLQAAGQIEGDALGDKCIRAERQMGPVVVERANGKDQARITIEQATDFGPGKVVQPQ